MRRATNPAHLLAAVVATMSLAACQGQPNLEWKIDVGVKNVGTNMMDGASVKWGEFRFVGGIVSPSNEAVHVAFDHPIPEVATVKYTLPNGKGVGKTVAVRKVIPVAAEKDKDITVMFEVNSNTGEVRVRVFHFIQKDGYSQLVPFE